MKPGEGCDNISIPDTTTTRSLHNLIFNPARSELLVCNNIRDEAKTTCDSWRPGQETWRQDHSSPHKEDKYREIQKELFARMGDFDLGGSYKSRKEKVKAEKRCGRYASTSLTMSGTAFIIGGQTNCDGNHSVILLLFLFSCLNNIVVQPVKTVKELVTKGLEGETYWKQSGEMKTERSFFCVVDLMDSAFMTIGGYSSNNKIINQTEYFVISRNQ